MKIHINSIQFNKSLVDGPGVRTLVFFQGCDIHCPGCQNPSAWDITKGTEYTVKNLAKIIKDGTFNGKITLTGGEPLMQKEALVELLKELKGLDVIVYTGHKKEDVPNFKTCAKIWKKMSEKDKKKYEKFAEEMNEERKKMRELFEIANGIQPKKPAGA